MDVYVREEWTYGGQAYYTVWVDGQLYDNFTLTKKPLLTWSQQIDVANGYKEALEHYVR